MNAFESSPAAITLESPYTVGVGAQPNETHMTRATGGAWWHTPAVAGTVALCIGMLIFIISISAFGADVSLMLRKLI